LLALHDNVEEINPKGGFVRYGNVKNTYVLIKGSISGSKKRMITFTQPIRPNKKIVKDAPSITFIQTSTNQGKARQAA